MQGIIMAPREHVDTRVIQTGFAIDLRLGKLRARTGYFFTLRSRRGEFKKNETLQLAGPAGRYI